MTDVKAELLPCPFCGGEARTGEMSTRGFLVGCTGLHGVMMRGYKTEDAAIAAWNTRAESQPALPEGVECECPTHGRWYAAEDIDRMVREIDVAMHGDGAAEQAKLCDIHSQIIERCATPLPTGPLDPADAPRDGRLLRLLVEFDDHALEDSADPVWTIGQHNGDNVGPDEADWQFAGWCWSHDHFTEGKGRVIGWLPYDAGLPK